MKPKINGKSVVWCDFEEGYFLIQERKGKHNTVMIIRQRVGVNDQYNSCNDCDVHVVGF
jgi:hypothetical protein